MKINDFKNKDSIRVDGDLVWFKKAGRAKANRNSFALTKEQIIKAAQMIEIEK